MAAKAPDHEKIQMWIRDLSNENFAVRTNATQALLKQGELAEHLLRKALDGKLDLETRRRIDALLSKIDQPVDAPEKRRQIRAIEVLEMLHGDQAQELLQRLAKGYVGHRQTRLAQESLSRLKQRSPAPETWLAWAKNSPASDKVDPLPLGARARLGTKLFRHEGHGKPAAFTADGQMVISHDQNAIYFWKAKTCTCLALQHRLRNCADMKRTSNARLFRRMASSLQPRARTAWCYCGTLRPTS